MPKQRKRPAGDRANPESESRKNCHESTRIPPRTPALIARQLARLFRRCDDLANLGANLTLRVGFIDTHGERTTVMVIDRASVEAMGRPPAGVCLIEIGEAVTQA